MKYNKRHGITPATIKKNVDDVLSGIFDADTDNSRVTATISEVNFGSNLKAHLADLRKKMLKAAENLEFEEAASIRDEVKRLETVDLAIAADPMARQSSIREAVSSSINPARSTAGRGGTRVYKGKSIKKF